MWYPWTPPRFILLGPPLFLVPPTGLGALCGDWCSWFGTLSVCCSGGEGGVMCEAGIRDAGIARVVSPAVLCILTVHMNELKACT